MTRKNVFGLLFIIFCVSGNISCNKYLLSEKDKEEEKENIFIESFEGVSNIDLSNRNNWILTMNYYYIYDYTIDGKRIKSFPKDEPCYIPGSFITEDNSGSPWVGLGSGPLILFASPNYYSEFISGSTDNAPPTFFDQTTEEKLLAADCLSCQYTGKASTVLSDMLQCSSGFRIEKCSRIGQRFSREPGTYPPLQGQSKPTTLQSNRICLLGRRELAGSYSDR